MMKIKIAHLYYDLMNLYGENGNVRALDASIRKQGIDVKIDYLTIDDKIDFKKYDIFYIGSGSERNQLIVLEDILKYKSDIDKAIKSGKIFIATGNSYELFGKYIMDVDNKKYNCLSIFNYTAKRINFRISEEEIYKTDLINEKIIGFENRSCIIKNIDNYLFEVIKGTGYEPNVNIEGFHKYNFYGTYLVGPLLIRNPYLTDYILKTLINNYKVNEDNIEYKAYHEYLKNFHVE